MKPSLPEESGFMTIWVLGLCVIVFFIGGLSLDLWRGFTDRRELSAMVDAAAVAGASQIDLAAFQGQPSVIKLDNTAAPQRALLYLHDEAARDGITLLDEQAQVINNQLQVTVSADLHLSLTRILLPNAQPVRVEVTGDASPQVVL